jgi:hypothetical protein
VVEYEVLDVLCSDDLISADSERGSDNVHGHEGRRGDVEVEVAERELGCDGVQLKYKVFNPPLSISVYFEIRLKFFESKNVFSTYSPLPSMHAWGLCNHS